MPKKVDPLLLGVWLVLQASQAPMGGWGPGAEPERGESCFRPSWGSRVRPLLRGRRGQRALPPGGGKGGQAGGEGYGVRGRDTSLKPPRQLRPTPSFSAQPTPLRSPRSSGTPWCVADSPPNAVWGLKVEP